MAYQCIKYRLTQRGEIPEYLYLGEDGVGGVYGVGVKDEPPPRDVVMIGVAKDGATGDFEVVASQADLQAYLTEVGREWVQFSQNPEDPPVPFDPVAAAQSVWNRLTALNG